MSGEYLYEAHRDVDTEPGRHADLRDLDEHGSWREVYRQLDCDTDVEPNGGDRRGST